jgi:hypothetical protein
MIAISPSATMTPPLSAGALAGLTALETGLQANPILTLSFYTFGILMHRMTEDGGETEYAVSPAQLAEALAVKVKLETGLLPGNTIYIASEGSRKAIVEYRPPQRTALFLDGSDTPVIVPLPGLIMGRVNSGSDSLRYGVYAVKARPESLATPLFNPPLPNVGNNAICWGSVRRVSDQALASYTLTEDWQLLLGSVFTNHGVNGKSKRYSNDIRQQWIDLDKRKARKYPLGDLVAARTTLGQWLGKSS